MHTAIKLLTLYNTLRKEGTPKTDALKLVTVRANYHAWCDWFDERKRVPMFGTYAKADGTVWHFLDGSQFKMLHSSDGTTVYGLVSEPGYVTIKIPGDPA